MNFFKCLFAGFSLTILSVVLLVSTSLADVEVVVVESEGRGISRDAAINAALSAAVAKVNGVSLTSNSRSISGQSSSQIENNSQSVSAISSRVDTQAAAQVRSRQYKNGQIPPVSDVTDVSVATTSRAQGIAVRASASKINNKTSYDASQKEIDVKTAGQIKSYEVLSFQEVPQGFIVRISASISKFVISIEAERTRIVVTPFRMKTRGNTTNEFERQFSQTLINQLTQSRKFAVLDRDYISEQGVELNLLQAGEVPIDEMTKLGNKLGTDFIIVGAVDEFVSRRRNLIMKSTGQEIPMIDQGARLSYRIINAATGQVKFSDTYDSIETKQGTAIASKIIANKAANEVSQNILMNFYPVMVEAIQGDTIVLGQGGDTVEAGQQFTLVQYGKEIIDSYTKESLGRIENNVGTIEITRVTNNQSYARILKVTIDVEANFEPQGFIVRPLPKKRANENNEKIAAKIKIETAAKLNNLQKESDNDW